MQREPRLYTSQEWLKIEWREDLSIVVLRIFPLKIKFNLLVSLLISHISKPIFFQAFADAGTVNQNYANILLMLLRLRQACDHPLLVKEYDFDSVGKISGEMAKRLPRDMLIDLLSRLETSSAICCVCSVSFYFKCNTSILFLSGIF